MSYRLTFFKGFDQATENFTDEQINDVFDALTEMAQEESVKPGEIKIGHNLWITVEVSDDTLHVTGVSTRRAKTQSAKTQSPKPQSAGTE